MADLMLVRAALRDPAIAAYPDFARAVGVMCDQLERFRSEREYIIGFNDGRATTNVSKEADDD